MGYVSSFPSLGAYPDVTPHMVERCGTVPLCFKSSDISWIRTARLIYGRTLLGRRARKQAFACDEIEFLDNVGAPLPRHVQLRPGHHVRVRVSVGESGSHLRKSANRYSISHELSLALMFIHPSRTQYHQFVRCIYVRTPAETINQQCTEVADSVVQWEVAGPSTQGSSTDSEQTVAQVPDNAMWLFDRGLPRAVGNRITQHDRPRLLLRICYEYGSSTVKGFGSLMLKTVLIGLCLGVVAWQFSLIEAIVDSQAPVAPFVTLFGLVVGLYWLVRGLLALIFLVSFAFNLP